MGSHITSRAGGEMLNRMNEQAAANHEVKHYTVEPKSSQVDGFLKMPSDIVEILGEQEKPVYLFVGRPRECFTVTYQLKEIAGKSNVPVLGEGWNAVATFLELKPGNLVGFRTCSCNYLEFDVDKLAEQLIMVPAAEVEDLFQ